MFNSVFSGLFSEHSMRRRLLFAGILLLMLLFLIVIPASTGVKSASEVPLVMVRIAEEEEMEQLYAAGLDPVQVDLANGEVFLAMGEEERAFLQSNGYAYEVLVQDMHRTEPLNTEFSTLSTPGPGRDDYRVWDDYVDEILQIANQYPDIVKLHIIGHSHWGFPIYALEICDAPGVKDGRPETLHEAKTHATEWPSGEMAIELAWYLTGNYGSDQRVTDILENIRTWVVPIFNPDGFIYHTEMDVRWRKNRRDNSDGTFGVDVNRNFSYLFGGHGSPDPGDWMSYWGPYPFSEPEAQAYGDLMLSNDFITVLRGHTYGETIFHEPPNDCDHDLYWDMINQISSWNNYRPRLGGQGGQSGNFVYGVMRAASICLEYQKTSQPPYEGYPAPGLETDEFGMMKGNNIWDSFPIEDPWPVWELEAELIYCGMGLSSSDYPAEVAGNIALIEQDESYYCVFDDQYTLARNAGAAALIIYYLDDGFTRAPNIRGPQVDIPVMVLMGEDGNLLVDHLAGEGTLTAKIVPDVFTQDSFEELWDRNLEPILYQIEQAEVLAPVIEGSVSDRVGGDLLPARLDKTVTLTAPFAEGVGRELMEYADEYMEHIHHTYIETGGSYAWHVSPSKQPRLDTPPYEITAAAPGYYPQTALLAVENFGEEHQLDFTLQPVIELQGAFALDNRWPVNSTVPFYFITVDSLGRPVDMEDVTVRVYSGETEIAASVEGEGEDNIRKGEGAGEYLLDGSTAGLSAGSYDIVVGFSGVEGRQSYRTELVLVEELVLEGAALIVIPGAGQDEETYAAFTVDETGSLVAAEGVNWSLEQPVPGVDVDSGSGVVTVESGAGAGSFTLTAEAGGLTGSIEVTLAGSELAAAIAAAEEAIDDLPAVVGLEDKDLVESARALVDSVLSLGGTESQVANIVLLVMAENKLSGLEKMMQAWDEAIIAVEAAIDSLPETITLEDACAVEAVRGLVKEAVKLGITEDDIANIEVLRAAEGELEEISSSTINAVEAAIANLPPVVSLLDESDIEEARSLVEEALDLGIERGQISNLDILIAAEEELSNLYSAFFQVESLFELGDPGSDNRNQAWFSNFSNYWSVHEGTDRSINGEYFAPLSFYSSSHRPIDYARYTQWDISERGYCYVEGYVGASDSCIYNVYDYPLTFRMLGDGQVLFEADLIYGNDAIFYRLDLEEVGVLRFEWVAKDGNTNDDGRANRPVIIEPLFFKTPDISEMIEGAETAIDDLPAEITLADLDKVLEARRQVNNALALGAEPADIDNLHLLEAAESDLEPLLEMAEALASAVAAIENLPAEVTLPDEPRVQEARSLVEQALALGVDETDLSNLDVLTAAENAIADLYRELFSSESLFELGDPGAGNYAGMEEFVDYENPELWRADYTITGRSFAPLKMFAWSGDMTTLGTPANPRWIEYDISGRGYTYLEGYLGAPDQSTETGYPLEAVILIDGEPAFEKLLQFGADAAFYRLDVKGAEKVEFRYWADDTGGTGHANHTGFVEPRFLIPNTEEAVAKAEDAIAELPAEMSIVELDEISRQLAGVRAQVENAFAIGVQPGQIGNLQLLEEAEELLERWLEIEGTTMHAVALAANAIGNLPDVITIGDLEKFFEAKMLVNAAFNSGAIPRLIDNLDRLEGAEAEFRQIIEDSFEAESLFALEPVDWLDGPLNEMSTRFADYHDTANWDLGRAVFGEIFDPLKVYSRGHRNLDQQPQWIEYDISEKGYDYVEGYIGIRDTSSSTGHHPTFRIYGEIDGELEILFEVEKLYRDQPAQHYFINLTGVDRIRFYLEAETVSANGWVNLIAFVEPQFLTADYDLADLIEQAEAAIAALPPLDDVTMEDKDDVAAARALVDQALALGAEEKDISNLSVLEEMEEKLAGLLEPYYGDVNGDGIINVADVIMVMQSVLGLIQLDADQQEAADVNGDGTINVDDVVLIMQRILNLIDKFPVES